MVLRAWVKLIWNSIGVAAIAAAAQLAVAQALGIIRWDATYPADDPSGWSALLTWIAFIYAVAVLGGAAIGRRALRRPTKPDTMPARIAAALSAGVGAALAVGLAFLPAQDAKPPVSVHPELLVALTAGTAIVAGIVIALFALSVPPIAGGIRAAVAWIWLVGIGSAIAGYVTYEPYDPPRLGVVDTPSLFAPEWWSGPYVMVGVAAILGVAVAAVARWAEAGRFGIAISGFAGPAVVASAYLIAGPGTGAYQLEPYRAALISLGAGLLTSALVAIPAPRRARVADRAAAVRQQHPAARDDVATREPAGRPEPRPLLDETYEPESYPDEAYPVDESYPAQPAYAGRGEERYDQPTYEQPTYDQPTYEQAGYRQAEYAQAEYAQAEYAQAGYGERDGAGGNDADGADRTDGADESPAYEPKRYAASQPEPGVYAASHYDDLRGEPDQRDDVPEPAPRGEGRPFLAGQPQPAVYQSSQYQPSQPEPEARPWEAPEPAVRETMPWETPEPVTRETRTEPAVAQAPPEPAKEPEPVAAEPVPPEPVREPRPWETAPEPEPVAQTAWTAPEPTHEPRPWETAPSAPEPVAQTPWTAPEPVREEQSWEMPTPRAGTGPVSPWVVNHPHLGQPPASEPQRTAAPYPTEVPEPPPQAAPPPPEPTPAPPPPPPPAPVESPRPAMGQPPADSYEEDYSEWLRDLGSVPEQRPPSDREDQHR